MTSIQPTSQLDPTGLSLDSPAADLVAAYVADILERSHTVQRVAEQLAAADDYVSPEAPQLIRALAHIVSQMRGAVIEQWTIYTQTESSKEVALLRGIDDNLRTIGGELRLPGRAISERVPGVLTRLVTKKAAELFTNASIILRPQWNYNYKIHRDDIHTHYRNLLKGSLDPSLIDECLKSLPSPLYIISFPFIERGSVHLHSLLGHELGHLMAREYRPPAGSDDAFFNSVLEKSRRLSGKKGSSQLSIGEEADIKKALAARQKAIKEFAADAASIYLFGIAALFGAAQVAVARGLRGRREADDRYYPNWGTRLVHMLGLAEAEGWLEIPTDSGNTTFIEAAREADKRLLEIKNWAGKESNKWSVSDTWIAAGHEAAQELVPDIQTYLRSKFSAGFADCRTTYKRLPSLFERLQWALPPDNIALSETEPESASLEDIFVASWWYRLWKVRPRFNGNDLATESIEESERIRRLTLKAIENIDLVDRFRSKIDELEK